METITQLTDKVLAHLPAPSSDKLESLQPALEQMKFCAGAPSKNAWRKPLRTEWQRRRFNLDALPPGVQPMVDACERWCRGVAKNANEGRCIILAGLFGCGKTHALDCSTRYVRDVRMAVWPDPWPRPLQFESVQWAKLVREVTENENRDYMDDVLASDVVFLDDIGSEEDRYKSGSPTRILGDCLGELHRQRRFVFITTNIAPSGWKARWDGRVEDRLMRLDADVVNLFEAKAESYAVWKVGA